MANEGRERDLILAPQQFAYIQDETKGNINTFVGPFKTSLSNTDKAVKFEGKRYIGTTSLDSAIQHFPFAEEGDYIVLENPAKGSRDEEHPKSGNNSNPPLEYGRKVNIAGPATFPLWPGQNAQVIKGHTLRSNQYLVVRVYNEEAARQNWGQAVLRRQTDSLPEGQKTDPNASGTIQPTKDKENDKIEMPVFVTGQNLVIRGTDYSFFIPPTGIEVVPDEDRNFVRDAVTLERLEYTILINENGVKRYEMGPAVVFPEPTEQFIRRTGDDNKYTRRFKAYSLSKLAGLYVQVIADYNDDGSKITDDHIDHRAGEELFIKGSDQAIYYPRPEHAIIKYIGADGKEQEVHNSVAIPSGEARYVLDRLTGVISLMRGPKMFLPDPRTQVIVRRVLTPHQTNLWFPGNVVAQAYNDTLAQMQAIDPTGGGSMNFVSEGTYRSAKSSLLSYGSATATPAGTSGISGYSGASGFSGHSGIASSQAQPPAASAIWGDQVRRGTNYVPPRSLVIDTKYDGAVCIAPHQGYAVQVVSKTGERKVVVGPDAYLMEYDETLEVVRLSTGKPKNTDATAEAVYLQVHNNKVSDIVEVETRDMCLLNLKLSYRVNFDGPAEKWFGVENYVKLLCDHIRSRLKAAVKRFGIEEFYQNATDIIRDTILGKAEIDESSVRTGQNKRTGMSFEENGMVVYDVEVLRTEITDQKIGKMLQDSMVGGFQSAIEINEAVRKLDATKRKEDINQQIAEAIASTRLKNLDIQTIELVKRLEVSMQEFANEIGSANKKTEIEQVRQSTENATHTAELARLKSRSDQDLVIDEKKQSIAIGRIEAETKALVTKFDSIKGDWTEAMLALSNNDTMIKMASASAPLTILGGGSISDVIMRMFENTPLKGALESMRNGNGSGIIPRQVATNQ